MENNSNRNQKRKELLNLGPGMDNSLLKNYATRWEMRFDLLEKVMKERRKKCGNGIIDEAGLTQYS